MTLRIQGPRLTPLCADTIGHSFEFLTDDRMTRITLYLRDLGRYRLVGRDWNMAGKKRQDFLMKKIRSFACPSIPEGVNLFARCSEFFLKVQCNMQKNSFVRSHNESQIDTVTLLQSGRYIFNRGKNHLSPIAQGHPVLTMGDLQNQNICKRLYIDRPFHPVELAITETNKLIVREHANERELFIWDVAQEKADIWPSAIITNLNFSRFCLCDQTIICVNESSIFFIDIRTKEEVEKRIPISRTTRGVAATQTKLCLLKLDCIDIFDRTRGCYEQSIILPDTAQGFGRFFIFNDQFFFATLEGSLYFIDLSDFSIRLIAKSPEVEARAVSIPNEENILRPENPSFMAFRDLGCCVLDKLILSTEDVCTRVYDLRQRQHLMTVAHCFETIGYNALYDGKLYIFGGEQERTAEGIINERDRVAVFDFNPPQNTQNTQLSTQEATPPVQTRAGCCQILWRRVLDFFMSIWNSLRVCLFRRARLSP